MPMASATAPTGTPSANSQGHERTARMALAMAGPAAADTAMTTAVMPMPWPKRCAGWMKRTSAWLTLITPAAPIPWATRASTSAGSDGDSAQASDATLKSTRPAR